MIIALATLYVLRDRLGRMLVAASDSERLSSSSARTSSDASSNVSTSNNEQIPKFIRDFSSQYGSNRSDSYVVDNIRSNPEIYPAYGDSTHALVFRTYGPWWNVLPSFQESNKHFTRSESHFNSKDFVEIEYQDFVYHCISLNIYETYNPGTVEVVYAGEEDSFGNVTWHKIWTFPEPFSIVLPNNQEFLITNGRQMLTDIFTDATQPIVSDQTTAEHDYMAKISTKHTYPAASHIPRIVKIPLENRISFRTRLFRIEFDHSTVQYYAEIDTVILCGLTSALLTKQSEPTEIELDSSTVLENSSVNTTMIETSCTILDLPFDILSMICSYLDLRSLVRFSSTCRSLYEQCLHESQFRSLNLQPYWNGVSDYSIENFFLAHCQQTRYLSLAWTRSIKCSSFSLLINACSTHIIHLNLSSCQYLAEQHLRVIADECHHIENLNLNNCLSLNNTDFLPLKSLRKLHALHLYRTRIDFRTLIPLINGNRMTLEHINLGSCQKLVDTIGIVKLIFSRCTNLRSIDLWRAHGLTINSFLSFVGLPFDVGEEKRRIFSFPEEEREDVAFLYCAVNMPIALPTISTLKYLSEVDLGWTDPPPGFVRSFLQQVGHSLIKLFLTACRRVNNQDIQAVSEYALQIRQLDLLGSSIITETTIECLLRCCLKMEFLDLSFCDKIPDETISIWSERYRICFKRSYPPSRRDDVTVEFP